MWYPGRSCVISQGTSGLGGISCNTWWYSLASGPATNGAVLRDALGFKFGDASNQTTYQQVGDELKALVQEQVGQGIGPKVSPGTTLRFTGIVSVTDTGMPQPPAKPVQVQPLTVEVVR